MSTTTSNSSVPPPSGHASDAELTQLVESPESASLHSVAAHVDICADCTQRLGYLAIEASDLQALVQAQRHELEVAFSPHRFRFPARSMALVLAAALAVHLSALATGAPLAVRVHSAKNTLAAMLQSIPELRALSQLVWAQSAIPITLISMTCCAVLLGVAGALVRRQQKPQLTG
jgi:hypothetical protein